MRRNKILLLSNRIPYPLNDGGSMAIHAMVEGYHHHGWDVFFFSMNTSRHYVSTSDLPELYNQIAFEAFDINTDIRLVATLRNFLLSRQPNHVDRFYSREFDARLRQIIELFEPDVIQIESIYLASYIPSIREVTEAKVAIRLHNIEFQIWERLAAETSISFKKYYLKDLAARIRRFEINAWVQADVLIPITEADAEVAKTHVPSAKMLTIPFGMVAKHRPEVDERWVGYHIGAMDWIPNAEAVSWFLEDVWPKLHAEAPEFKFYFAGRNMPGYFEKYKQEGVECAGEVPNADQFIADKKILIVPIRSAGGIRVKILEAFAAEKVVISTPTGTQGIEGLVPGKHYLVAETADEFVAQIKWVLDNKDEARAIARNGALFVHNRYDQDMIMRRFLVEMDGIVHNA